MMPSLAALPARPVRQPAVRLPPELRCLVHAEPLFVEGGLADVHDVEHGTSLTCNQGCQIPIVRGIPRFVPTEDYAAAFGWQWRRFARSQLDSHTGTTISRDRLRRCLGGSLDVVRGKRVLEAGCGAGRFTEILLDAGARVVAADLSSAVDANHANCGRSRGYFVCQADIRDLPVAPRSFDVVLCLGVIQHTPDPEATIEALAGYVKPNGLLAIDHYSRDYPVTTSRRVLRSMLLKLSPERASRVALGVTRGWLRLHRALWRDRRGFGRLRGYLARVSPVVDYYTAYPELGRDLLAEWALLDTHDTLTDRYKHLRAPEEIEATLLGLGLSNVAVSVGGNGVEARAMGSARIARDVRPRAEPSAAMDRA
jgi:2-polyprenyl-3-methyl-5-hydroxy-6-metoxy-1,4-benzoquinol methylase